MNTACQPEPGLLLTDLYQLTMNAVYVACGKNTPATFDLFIRTLPGDWGYFIANGIEDAVDYLIAFRCTPEDLDFLRTRGFTPQYLDFLKDFRFTGAVHAVAEGTPVFPGEPLMRITAERTQAQLVETALLNTVTYQTMVATKAARVAAAAAPAAIVDFGLRRAHGCTAGMTGARAAYLAGAAGTSNVAAARQYGIPVSGTHAHSFIMSFPTELEAFRAYVSVFDDRPTLLIDTYDTLQGARNACVVGREMAARGHQLGSVRLDSGNLAALAIQVRAMLDEAGLQEVKIIASSDLDEYKITELKERAAPIDLYGVGTEMITGRPVAAISGVYKIVEDLDGPKIKLSAGKQTLPGKKQIYRQVDADGVSRGDTLAREHETVSGTPLLEPVVRDGARVRPRPALDASRARCREEIARLPESVRALRVQEHYPVDLSPGLQLLVDRLTGGDVR